MSDGITYGYVLTSVCIARNTKAVRVIVHERLG